MRNLFTVEKGIRITETNSSNSVSLIFGNDVPDGVTGEQSSSGLGSIYVKRGSSPQIYQKITNNGNSNDYIRLLNYDDYLSLSWRSEKVVVVTNETLSIGVKNCSTFIDDENNNITSADFIANVSYVIGGASTSPVLYKVTNVSGNNITLQLAEHSLKVNDMFVVTNYLPDQGDSQEKNAIVLYNGSNIIKISDFNWNVADSIKLIDSYNKVYGLEVSNTDSVNSALEKLDGNLHRSVQSLGIPKGSGDLGSFTGNTLPNNTNVKTALQIISDVIESQSILNIKLVGSGVITIDEFYTNKIYSAKYYVHVTDTVTNYVNSSEIYVCHNRNGSNVATNIDVTVYATLRVNDNSISGLEYSFSLSGSGSSQRVVFTSTSTNNCIYRVKRVGVIDI